MIVPICASDLAAAADLHRHVPQRRVLSRSFKELFSDVYHSAAARAAAAGNPFSKILQRLAAAEVNSTCTQLGPIIQEESLSARRSALKRTQADAVKRFQAAVQLQTQQDIQHALSDLKLPPETLSLLAEAAAAPGATMAAITTLPGVTSTAAAAALNCAPPESAVQAHARLVAHSINSHVNKARGLQHEPAALQAVEKQTGRAVTERNSQLYEHDILLQGRSGEVVTVRLRGRVDGWLEGEGAIVEVKNRFV
jgi:hypothetical protein